MWEFIWRISPQYNPKSPAALPDTRPTITSQSYQIVYRGQNPGIFKPSQRTRIQKLTVRVGASRDMPNKQPALEGYNTLPVHPCPYLNSIMDDAPPKV